MAAMDKVTLTVSTPIATPPKSTKSSNSNSSVHIQIKPKSQFEFVPRDTEKSEFLDLVDFGGVAISVETVVGPRHNTNWNCCEKNLYLALVFNCSYYFREERELHGRDGKGDYVRGATQIVVVRHAVGAGEGEKFMQCQLYSI